MWFCEVGLHIRTPLKVDLQIRQKHSTRTSHRDRNKNKNKLEGARAQLEQWQKLAEVMPANSLRDFALQTMFDLLITIANRQLSDITSRYALRAVDLKDMVVIDLWNAGE